MTQDKLEKLNQNRRNYERLTKCLDFINNKDIGVIEFHTHIGKGIDDECFSITLDDKEIILNAIKVGIFNELDTLDNEFVGL